MKIYNENNELMTLEQCDLKKGHLINSTRIKDNASPIDNETKFAWDNEDYEDIQLYALFPEDKINKNPTQLDRIEAQVAYTAMMTNSLLEG